MQLHRYYSTFEYVTSSSISFRDIQNTFEFREQLVYPRVLFYMLDGSPSLPSHPPKFVIILLWQDFLESNTTELKSCDYQCLMRGLYSPSPFIKNPFNTLNSRIVCKFSPKAKIVKTRDTKINNQTVFDNRKPFYIMKKQG